MKKWVLIMSVFFAHSTLAFGQEKVVHVPHVGDQIITVDGKLGESEWKDAVKLVLQVSTGKKVEYFQPTDAYMIWNDSTIFVAYRVSDSYIVATDRELDGQMYYDDCVEVFLAPIYQYDSLYFGWEMNSNGQYLDFVFFPHHIESSNLILTAFAATKIFENGVVVGWEHEISIPITAFSNFETYGPLKDGAKWKFQLSRWDYQKETSLFSSYTVTGEPSPHVFSRMAVLEFTK
jgi:hypothetical protein